MRVVVLPILIAADAAARIRAITALLDPKPAPADLVCSSCGHADRLLVDSGVGTMVCLNVDRCHR